MLAFGRVETVGGVLALLIVAAAVVTLARILTGREARWRRVRVGLFVERDRVKGKPEEEYDWEPPPRDKPPGPERAHDSRRLP